MARTHLRVAARPDVWSELVAYVITAETATTAVQSWRADGLSPTRGLPRREWASGSLLARDK